MQILITLSIVFAGTLTATEIALPLSFLAARNIMQDTGLLGRLYAEGHKAVERAPGKGLDAVGANGLQKHRFAIFIQSFPVLLALSLFRVEANTRSAAVLGFVGAGGIGLRL